MCRYTYQDLNATILRLVLFIPPAEFIEALLQKICCKFRWFLGLRKTHNFCGFPSEKLEIILLHRDTPLCAPKSEVVHSILPNIARTCKQWILPC